MSFHDSVALKARLDGNTSAQFRQAAQRHANATLFYLIIAAVLLYFANWMWALIPFALAAYVALQSVSSTLVATKLEKLEITQGTAPTDADQKLRLLLRASIEIVSVFGAVLEQGSNSKIPTIKQSEADLPFSKQQISQAIAVLQQALGHPRLRAILIELLSPMEAQQILSSQFERSLESGLVLLDTFVPAEEVEAERKQWNETLKVMDQIDPTIRERIESTLATARRTDEGKIK